MWDWLIEGARVVDGTGNPWYDADLALAAGRIAAVGRLPRAEARHRIDARGLVAAPGFIDSHTHSEAFALADPAAARVKLAQGVTTDLMGLCGLSAFPVVEGRLEELQEYMAGVLAGEVLSWQWHGYADLVAQLESHPLLMNAGSMVGHGSVRLAVMGTTERAADTQELAHMQSLVARALDEGAVGVSFGLLYAPGCFACGEELAAIAAVAACKGRPCIVHLRDEGDRLLDSVAEVLVMARASGCRLVISHLKAAGPANWGKVREVLAVLDRVRDEGLDVRVDAYPYTAGCPWIAALLPPWVHEGGLQPMLQRLRDADLRRRIGLEIAEVRGTWENLVRSAGWDRIVLQGYPPDPHLEGKDMAQLARAQGRPPAELLMDVVVESKGQATVAVFDLSEEDVDAAVTHPLSMVISDGGPSPGLDHPRLHGAFPRVLERYVRTRGMLTLEDAVRKMTSYVAQTYNLADRGEIRPGLRADLVMFDPAAVEDRASYQDPSKSPAGIRSVFVAGQMVFNEGELTGARPGEPVAI